MDKVMLWSSIISVEGTKEHFINISQTFHKLMA